MCNFILQSYSAHSPEFTGIKWEIKFYLSALLFFAVSGNETIIPVWIQAKVRIRNTEGRSHNFYLNRNLFLRKNLTATTSTIVKKTATIAATSSRSVTALRTSSLSGLTSATGLRRTATRPTRATGARHSEMAPALWDHLAKCPPMAVERTVLAAPCSTDPAKKIFRPGKHKFSFFNRKGANVVNLLTYFVRMYRTGVLIVWDFLGCLA